MAAAIANIALVQIPVGNGSQPQAPARGFRLGPDLLKRVAEFIPLGSDTSFLCVNRQVVNTDSIRQRFLMGRGDVVTRIYLENGCSFPENILNDLLAFVSNEDGNSAARKTVANTITELHFNFSDAYNQPLYSDVERSHHFPSTWAMERFASYFPNVKKISITSKYIGDREAQHILENFPGITSFSLENGENFCAFGIHNVMQTLTSLTSLRLKNCSDVSMTTLFNISRSQSLESLELLGCSDVDRRSVEQLDQLQTLKTLTMTHFYEIEETFQHLKAQNPQLIVTRVKESDWQEFLYQLQDFLISFGNNLEYVLDRGCVHICDALAFVFDSIELVFEKTFEFIFDTIESIFTLIDKAFEFIFESIANSIETGIRVIAAGLDTIFNILDNFIEIIARALDSLANAIDQIFS